MRVTVVWPHPGGLHLEEDLFIGQLNTSQVLSNSPGKAGPLSSVMSSMLRIHKQDMDSWRKKTLREEFGKPWTADRITELSYQTHFENGLNVQKECHNISVHMENAFYTNARNNRYKL